MRTTRRNFLSTAGTVGLATSISNFSGHGAQATTRARQPDAEARHARLLEILRQPVLKKGLFTSPVIIQSSELLRWENSYGYFEEPVMYDDFEAIKRVADALTIPIANGEQDHGFVNFRWLIANDGIEIVQPDSYHFGGLIRCVKVGRMAAAFGKTIVPHMSGGGLGFLYNLHLVSVLPNAGAYHEFKGFDTQVRFECKTSPLKVVGGKIKVPTGPGSGVELDPEFVKKHQPVTA
ncbi:MAG: hypothetical protein GX456_18340 [Verrucomicrobia bacterium]|nr:hypothetical protein [Verrucomicrobiota bacterium]